MDAFQKQEDGTIQFVSLKKRERDLIQAWGLVLDLGETGEKEATDQEGRSESRCRCPGEDDRRVENEVSGMLSGQC